MEWLKRRPLTLVGAASGLVLHSLFFWWAKDHAMSYLPMMVEFILAAPFSFLVALVFNGRSVSMEQIGILTLVGASMTSMFFGALVGYQFDYHKQKEIKSSGAPELLFKLLLSVTAALYYRPAVGTAPYPISIFEHHYSLPIAIFIASFTVLSITVWAIRTTWTKISQRRSSS